MFFFGLVGTAALAVLSKLALDGFITLGAVPGRVGICETRPAGMVARLDDGDPRGFDGEAGVRMEVSH